MQIIWNSEDHELPTLDLLKILSQLIFEMIVQYLKSMKIRLNLVIRFLIN